MITFDELNIPHLPSGRLWRGFAPPTSFSPLGTSTVSQSGNPSFGFYDNFLTFHNTSAEGPYRIVVGAGCTVAQVADTVAEKGLIRLSLDGNLLNDEAILQWGRGIGAPFQLAANDLVFETRLSISNATAGLSSWAVGLAAVGAGASDGLLTDGAPGNIADVGFVGFSKLSSAPLQQISGAYRAPGQAVQNGAVNSRLANLANPASNVFIKLGFRYQLIPQTVEWFVNGVLAGTSAAPARLTSSQIVSPLFPSTVLMAPVIAIKDIAGTTAHSIAVDWWACAQNI